MVLIVGGLLTVRPMTALPTTAPTWHDKVALYEPPITSAAAFSAMTRDGEVTPNGNLRGSDVSTKGVKDQARVPVVSLQEPIRMSLELELTLILPSGNRLPAPSPPDTDTKGIGASRTVTGIVNEESAFPGFVTVTVNMNGSFRVAARTPADSVTLPEEPRTMGCPVASKQGDEAPDSSRVHSHEKESPCGPEGSTSGSDET
mmetsp:Transcript_28678/g.72187  ORF Transcript_28678/g.72187 Transcript_28678/m.72187 type:complete len:202 (+) Transcript_28678:168-773(+)